MPSIHVEMFEGRTLEQKRVFVEAVTRATCETLGTSAKSVDIVITDIKREDWATGGKLWWTREDEPWLVCASKRQISFLLKSAFNMGLEAKSVNSQLCPVMALRPSRLKLTYRS